MTYEKQHVSLLNWMDSRMADDNIPELYQNKFHVDRRNK